MLWTHLNWYLKYEMPRNVVYSTSQEEMNERNQLLSLLYEGKGDYKNAWLTQKRQIEKIKIFASLGSFNSIMTKRYFFDQQNTEQNNNTQLQARDTQWKVLLTLLSLVFVAVLGWFLFKNRQKKQAIRLYKEQELEKKVRELNLKALQAQMAPHFTFNCLNTLKSLILDEKSKEARVFMASFSKLLREIFDNFKEDYIPLEQELTFLKHYIGVEHGRFHQSFTYQIKMENEERMNDTQWLIPPMLIQPIIENALKYGMSAEVNERNNLLVLFLNITDGVLKVRVEDNCIQGKEGIDMANLTQKWDNSQNKMSATQITFERLKLLRGGLTYNKKDGGGTVATLFIPLKY